MSTVIIGVDPPGAGPYGSLAALAEAMAARVRATDLVAVIPPGFLALLLVDAPMTSLQSVVGRLAAQTGLSDTRAVWSAGGSCYPESDQRIVDLFHRATGLLLRAAAEGGNQLLLPPS